MYVNAVIPYQCVCTESSTEVSSICSLPLEKLKVCMHSYKGDGEAQMLAQIKSLPEGDMKTALLETYIKTIKAEQKGQTSDTTKKQPLFLDASYENVSIKLSTNSL
jgi:hypothetical protein